MEGASGYLGTIVIVALAAIGAEAGYVTLRATFAAFRIDAERRFNEFEADRKELRNRIEQVDREKVNREDFIRLDDKIALRFEKIEHAVNNGALKTAQIVKEALRDLLPGVRS